MIDLAADLHTHSDLTDGAANPEAMADAAAAAGLTRWALSDHVRRDSTWTPEYVARVRGLRRPGLMILCAVEAKILDADGALDLPPGLADLDHVLVADHQFPSADGPVSPRAMTEHLAAGRITAAGAVDALVAATGRALAAAPFRPIAAHLFSLLPKMGLSEDLVGDDHLAALAAACRAAGGAVEINEKWRCPSPRVLRALRDHGVELAAASDAHDVGAVGRFDYVRAMAAELADA